MGLEYTAEVSINLRATVSRLMPPDGIRDLDSWIIDRILEALELQFGFSVTSGTIDFAELEILGKEQTSE